MGGMPIEGEMRTSNARVHVYTYRYAQPSAQTRSPRQDVLAFFACRQTPNAAGYFKTNAGVSRMLPIGNLVLIPAGSSISASGDGGTKRIISCTMAEGLLPATFDRHEQRYLARCGDIRDERLASCMRRLGQEALQPGFGSDILVDALTAALRIDLARYFETAAPAQLQAGGLSSWQLRRIEDYAHATEGARIRVADLAAVAEVSSGHLMRAFRQSTGKTVHQFVEEMRLSRARTLLGQSNQPLKQIASRLGFATPSSFSLAFRRATAMTPAQYRRAAIKSAI